MDSQDELQEFERIAHINALNYINRVIVAAFKLGYLRPASSYAWWNLEIDPPPVVSQDILRELKNDHR